MKPGILAKSSLRPTGPSAGGPEGRYDLARARSAVLTSPEKKERSRSNAERHSAIRVTSRFDASPDRVFDAWLDRKIAGKWLFATASRPMARVAIDARVGGSFCFVDRRHGEDTEHTGEYLEIDRPRRLVFTLFMEAHSQAMTRAVVEIAPLGTGCKLTLTHENVPSDYASHTENRWTGILYGLGVTLDALSGHENSR